MVQMLVLWVKSSVLMFESWYLGQKLINIGENLVLEVIPAYLLELKKKRLKKKKKKKMKQDLAKGKIMPSQAKLGC